MGLSSWRSSSSGGSLLTDDPTQSTLKDTQNGLDEWMAATLFVQTGAFTVTGVTTDTSLIAPSFIGTNVLPAGYFVQGKYIEGELIGIYNTTVGGGMLQFSLNLDGGSASIVGSSKFTNQNGFLSMKYRITCINIDGNGDAELFMYAEIYSQGSTSNDTDIFMTSAGVATIDSSTTSAIEPLVSPSSGSDSIQIQQHKITKYA